VHLRAIRENNMATSKQTEEKKGKEYFELRWEYLKRSDRYKEFQKIHPD
jgi:hypothetical protein